MTGVEISPLNVKDVAYLLVDGYWQVSVVDEIDSTQNFLKMKRPNHGEVIAAEFQSAGRGRLNRTFEANKSRSLLFSFYYKPEVDRESWGWIPLVAGMAVTNILNKDKNIFVTKWPNDVLVLHSNNSEETKKVAGVLVEVHSEGVIIGIGINVGMQKEELPVDTATSLAIEGLTQLDRNQLLADVLNEFARLVAQWESGFDLAPSYCETSSTIGRKVKVDGVDGASRSGRATGVGLNGELLLEGDQAIYSGDVIHLYT
ncbi:MAG: hypothetical protein RL414_370 [Actinomycetota bacterium]|jgi:BirA family biotin operon repressor/biotin-[acetyl-CoA-carboxylase] ligase